MTKSTAIVALSFFVGLATANTSSAGSIPENTRSAWETVIAKCVTAVSGDAQPFSQWEQIEVNVPGAYSQYEKFEQKAEDIAVILATRDNLKQCRILRIGDGVRDGVPESVDRAIFGEIIPRQNTTIGNVEFILDDEGVPEACILGQSYELRADFVVRTGNATIRLGPPSSLHGGAKPC